MRLNYKHKPILKTTKFTKRKANLLFALFFMCVSFGFYAQQTYTFTSAGAVGRFGPTQAQLNAAYASTNLNGLVTSTNGVQSFVANGGLYRITVVGAHGGTSPSYSGGFGASMQGEFNIPTNSVIRILVGQHGEFMPLAYNGGGGGGSFVWISGQTMPLIAAGGGGGQGASYAGVDAALTTSGTAGNPSTQGTAGTNGNGANPGGGGWFSDGAAFVGPGTGCTVKCSGGTAGTTPGGASPASYISGIGLQGCSAMIDVGDGGFGGGTGGNGNCSSSYGAGGGGGYSGGVGQADGTINQSGGVGVGGGGGGSYNGGTNQVNAISTRTGDGIVIIEELCNIALSASGSNSLTPVICVGQSLTLTTNAISNYVWSTGATTSSLVVAPTTNTVYTLTATSPSNCTASKSISVTVSGSQPTLSVVSSTNQTCLGKTATLTASGAVNYTWTNGVINGVSFYPSSTTTYTVTGDNGCGVVTAVATITVSPLALSVASSGTAVCTNKTATLTASAAATSYTWNPGNIVGTSPVLIVNPQATTIYTVTATDGTCVGVTNVALQADPVPTITSSSSATLVCPGGSISLSASGGINYTWTPVNQNGANIVVNPNVSTLFSVQGDNSFGCLGSSSQVIVVGAQPTLALTSNASTICNGNSATLTAAGANSYAWTGGPTTNTYVVSPTQATTYTAVGTHSSSGCFDVKTISINVFSPSLTISGNTVVCNGVSSNLSASGGVTYTWNPGGLPFQGITVTPSSNSVYTVTGVANQGALNCPVSATVEVNVNPTPTVTVTAAHTAVCPKETNTITAGGASTYTWVSTNTTVVNSSINVSSPNATVLMYTLTGSSSLGCESSINVAVNILPCTGLSEASLNSTGLIIYPNPSNGSFVIQSLSTQNIVLLNELGQVVNKLKLNQSNDFKISVNDLSNGVYFLVGDQVKQKIVVQK